MLLESLTPAPWAPVRIDHYRQRSLAANTRASLVLRHNTPL